ncbi:uncharacterized protein [Panulirus ornatus]|uniref:uncharacterized protein n=1 Tax=Panulirus ornatus TaxID=150431 RepID=UPI003A889E54
MGWFLSCYLSWYAGEPAEGLANVRHRVPGSPFYKAWVPGDVRVINAISEVACAITCHKEACINYTYHDGVCTMEGVADEAISTTKRMSSSEFRPFTNIAFNKTSYSSQHYPQSGPDKAVDSETCQTWNSSNPDCCFVSYFFLKSWWVVDLGEQKRVHIVDIAPAINYPFKNLQVRVGQQLIRNGNVTQYQLLNYYPDHGKLSTLKRVRLSNPEGIVGRFVSIQTEVEKNLILCDVMVLASDDE